MPAITIKNLLISIVTIAALLQSTSNAYCQEGSDRKAAPLAATGFVSWWTHDAIGYHPAIMMKVENVSSEDLTGQALRFQARFTDMHNGYLTVGHREMRQDFREHQQIFVSLKGPSSFELPIDVNNWPAIECKILCRVGDVSDEGTQDLLTARLESVTLSDDEARDKLSQQQDFRHVKQHTDKSSSSSSISSSSSSSSSVPTKPIKPIAKHAEPPLTHAPEATKALLATASSLKAQTLQPAAPLTSFAKFVREHNLPAVGDDFFAFERTYGLPLETDSEGKAWTWAYFKKAAPALKLYVGSQGHTGKADIVIFTLNKSSQATESELLSLAKLSLGKSKGTPTGPPLRHARNVGANQLDILEVDGRQMHSAIYIPENGSQYVVAASRLDRPIDGLLQEECSKTKLLQLVGETLGAP